MIRRRETTIRSLTHRLDDFGLRAAHLQWLSLSSVGLCIGLWIRAKTVDQDERGNAERRALFVGLWLPTIWLIGRTLRGGHLSIVHAEMASLAPGGRRDTSLETDESDRSAVVDRLAYLAEINAVHPFRKGNGRTQRAFIGQLAENLHYHISWDRIDPYQNIEASRAAHEGDERPLRNLLSLAISDLPSTEIEEPDGHERSWSHTTA